MQGLTDSDALKIIIHNDRKSGGHNWPKTFLSCVNVYFVLTPGGGQWHSHTATAVAYWFEPKNLDPLLTNMGQL